MSEAENTQIAKDAYAAFGRGDIPAVLGVMTDDIEWVFPGPAEVLPNAGTFTGKEAVGAWFGTLDATVEFQVFEPREFIAQGDKLVALGIRREHCAEHRREARRARSAPLDL